VRTTTNWTAPEETPMSDSYDSLKYETVALERPSPHVLVVRLNRPEVFNAMNTQMGLDLRDLWARFYVDPGEVRCIVLTGSGEKAFCAGGDLKQRNNMTNEEWMQQHAIFEQATMHLVNCPVPVIAAVNGVAFGGGTEMALACDFAYAAPNARFALTEVTLGIMPGAMGTQNMPRAVGVRRAKEIILTGLPFDAQQAYDWGVVNHVSEAGKLMDDVLKTAGRIADNAPISTRQAKKSMQIASGSDLHTGYLFEIEAYNRMVPTEDRLEGVRAFNEKRKPAYRGQ